MNLAAIADHVCTKIGKTDTESVAACKSYIRQRHEMIYDAGLWKDTVGTDFTASVEAEATEVILPWECARPLVCWKSGSNLGIDVMSLVGAAIVSPASLSTVGGSLRFAEIDSVGWAYDLGDGSRLSFINSGSSDVDVNITGTRNLDLPGLTTPDDTASETVTVPAGGAAELTTITWTSISRMTKAQSAVPLLVAQTAVIPEPLWVWPGDVEEASWARLRLINPQAEAFTLAIIGKKRFRQMNLDTDAPMIRGIDNALIAFATADMLERGRQFGKAQAKVAEATQLVQLAKDVERGQAASSEQIIPEPYMQEGEGYW